jgi:hypothetical protein
MKIFSDWFLIVVAAVCLFVIALAVLIYLARTAPIIEEEWSDDVTEEEERNFDYKIKKALGPKRSNRGPWNDDEWWPDADDEIDRRN